MSPESRIASSTYTLDKFERGGIASMENLPLIREELAVLMKVAADHPKHAGEIDALVRRWQRYMIRMKTGH